MCHTIKFFLMSSLVFFFYLAFGAGISEGWQREQIFSQIYHDNLWGSSESFSGKGSEIATTLTIRSLLPSILSMLGINVMVDVGCGDYNWMKSLSLPLKHYIGIDIVVDIIEQNNVHYADKSHTFLCRDVVNHEVPRGDLIFCKDVLQHLSDSDIRSVLNNFKKSEAAFLFTTTYFNTKKNVNISSGDGRPLNLLLPPFNFPEPLISFDEISAETDCCMRALRKRMSLWRLEDIPNL